MTYIDPNHAEIQKIFGTTTAPESRAAVTGDQRSECDEPEHQPGELDGYGRCRDCGLNYSANVGVYFCFACSEE